jgi:lipid-binding SYLF domain-containing protein
MVEFVDLLIVLVPLVEKPMRQSVFIVAVLAGVVPALSGCQSPPKTEAGREKLSENAGSALTRMKEADPGFARFLDHSYGYVIFPTVGKGGLGVGGAYGHGEVFEQGHQVGYAELSQASIGLQAGGQEYSEVIVFEDAKALNRFKDGKFTFAAQASAVALKSGVSTNAKYTDGVAVFTNAVGGLMAEASVGGQKFSYQPLQ